MDDTGEESGGTNTKSRLLIVVLVIGLVGMVAYMYGVAPMDLFFVLIFAYFILSSIFLRPQRRVPQRRFPKEERDTDWGYEFGGSYDEEGQGSWRKERRKGDDGSMFDDEREESWSLFKEQDREEEYKRIKKGDLI
ncbi:hypothetical protein EF808_06005 [archaeon]|nr:MAG: hypothetical protein EF808_06005 [archaeon]